MTTSNADSWTVRVAGAESVQVATPSAVLEGLREGDWEPDDTVRGPHDTRWITIEEHPAFADAVAEMGPPLPIPEDDTRLDMNPLIDVALVLLIFFILTASYSSFRRSIDLPPSPDPDGVARVPLTKHEDVKDRCLRLKVSMDGPKSIFMLDGRGILQDNLERELTEAVRARNRSELLLIVADEVPWGVEARIHDAAKQAGINKIYWPTR